MLDVGKEGYPSCVCICNNVCTCVHIYIYTTQIYTIYTYSYTYTYTYTYTLALTLTYLLYTYRYTYIHYMHCIVYAIFNESPQWFPSIYKSSGINLEFPPSQPFKLGPSAFPLGILAMIDSISGYGHLEIKKRSGSLICLTKSRHLESKPSRLVMTSFPAWNHLWIIKGYWGSW